jgi:putative FmdB family regulatory protein
VPIYDNECQSCGNVFEAIVSADEEVLPCPQCGADSKRILSYGGVNCFNNDAGWIKSVLDVVDKDSKDPATVQFRKDPTRENYHRWMKSRGLRPMEPGEERTRRKPLEEFEQRRPERVDRMMKGLRKRRRLEIRSHA